MPSHCRIAVAGLGLVGRRHADRIAAMPGVTLAGVADPSDRARVDAGAMGRAWYPALDALLDAEAPDGVIIASPTTLHVEQAALCIERGVPVLIEKPIGVSVAETAPLVARAEAAGVPILTGHHRRHNPLIHAARDVIAQGKLGRIRAVQATCWFYKPDAYFAEAPWRTQKGAGPISVNLAHDIDLLRHLCGEIACVTASATPSIRGAQNEDVAAALLEFASGAIGTISVSDGAVSPWSWELTSAEYPVYPVTQESCYQIAGTEGALSIPDLRLWTHEGAPDWWTPIRATSLIRGASDPLVNQIAHFADVIAGRAAPLVSGREGLRTLQVIEAIQRAAATRERVAITPA
ncbi:Gfo/Idh/MocA family oxidoreductase [Maribius pontilimi]|uniref:Gfo/Idh/MocA family oxidoreductase n=1 Tax=Palleronia pontilimi TaxID=1964209 RepID=A0A934MDR1_9RHOB|nr:Gfo/Idh/MocA family oxidoreductase [Palleronia pontilimi]MBJ3763755.1 Gfo/Idh/MocA family oxidoreductase [Palleronia pontilimi]